MNRGWLHLQNWEEVVLDQNWHIDINTLPLWADQVWWQVKKISWNWREWSKSQTCLRQKWKEEGALCNMEKNQAGHQSVWGKNFSETLYIYVMVKQHEIDSFIDILSIDLQVVWSQQNCKGLYSNVFISNEWATLKWFWLCT